MGRLLSYSIVSGLIMLAMYLVYKLFIAREKQYGFNRGILLLIYFVSFSTYPLSKFIDQIAVKTATHTAMNIIEVKNLTIDTPDHPVWGTILIWIYLTGASLVAVKTIITWIKIIRVIQAGDKVKTRGFTLVIMDNDKIAPFSWVSYVVINRADFDNQNSAIIAHELKHIRAYHWLDLLIAQIVCVVNWFNPAAWLMRDELMLVHEYQADMAVIQAGHSPKEYQMLLIKKAVGVRFPSLANSINHSKLKKRITMMYKTKSGAGSKLKALALVPMLALALSVTSVPAVNAAVSTINSSDISLDEDEDNVGLPPTAQFKISSMNNSGSETTVEIKGEGLGNFLSIADVSFNNKGNTFNAKSVRTTMKDGGATIKTVFPFSDNYENASVVLNVNGQEVKLNLDDFLANAQSDSASISSSNGIVISHGNATLSVVGDMEIYLDGKKINEEEMKALNPETIATMTIDRQNNTINITSK